MYTYNSSIQQNAQQSIRQAYSSSSTITSTEEQVLNKYLPCIPDQGEDQNINEILKKSQQQYQHSYHQMQFHYQMKKSSEQLDEDRDQQNSSNTLASNQQPTLNTPQYTKLVIDKIVSQLTGPSDDLCIQLHILHMRQLAQEQEKSIQRAMIEGERSKFNRKACEFSAVEREEPSKFCADYYEQQLQLQQSYLSNYQKNKNSSDSNSNTQSTFNSYTQSGREQQSSSTYEQSQRFLSDNSNNVLQSRSINITYSTPNTPQIYSKTSSNSSQGQPINNNTNDCLKQTSYTQQGQQQMTYTQSSQQQTSQQQNVQLQNTSNTVSQSANKNNKENKISTQSAGKENANISMGIINSKISKESKTKKRAQTQIRHTSNQNIQTTSNINNTQNTPLNPLNANNNTQNGIPQLTHQQQSAPAGLGQQIQQTQQHSLNQAPTIQTGSYSTGYNNHSQSQQYYGNQQYGYRNIYQSHTPSYYNQPNYTNQNNQQMYAPTTCPTNYYYPQSNTPRSSSSNYSTQQYNGQNVNVNNTSNNQSFFTKQENYIEENNDIASQIESPLIGMTNSSNHNNHSLHQSTYEDFFRNQDHDQQLPIQVNIQQQNAVQQPNLDDDLENAEVDDMINNYLS